MSVPEAGPGYSWQYPLRGQSGHVCLGVAAALPGATLLEAAGVCACAQAVANNSVAANTARRVKSGATNMTALLTN